MELPWAISCSMIIGTSIHDGISMSQFYGVAYMEHAHGSSIGIHGISMELWDISTHASPRRG